MKTLTSLATALLLLSGCSLFYDAPRLDADLGNAQTECWSKQVAFNDYRYADRLPTGLGGVPSEQIMKIYNQSFGEKPKEEEFFKMQIAEQADE